MCMSKAKAQRHGGTDGTSTCVTEVFLALGFKRPRKRAAAHNIEQVELAMMQQNKDFRDIVDSYFEECLHLTRAAKVVGLSDLAPKAQLATLWGLIEVLDTTARAAQRDIQHEDQQQFAVRKPFLGVVK